MSQRLVMHRSFIVALLLLFALGSTACGGKKQRKADKDAAERQRAAAEKQREKDKVQEPSQQELSDSPCGNPRWAKLPEGSEGKVEDDTSDDAASDDSSDDEPAGDSSDSSDAATEGSGDC